MRTISVHKPAFNRSFSGRMQSHQQVVLHFTPSEKKQEVSLTLTDSEAQNLWSFLSREYNWIDDLSKPQVS